MINANFIGLRQFEARSRAISRDVGVATMRGVNRTAEQTRTLASKKIREQVGLKKGYVDERLKIRRASAGSPWAEISTPTRGLLLSRFAHSEKKKGVAVRVKPKGRMKLIPRAFLARLRHGTELGDNVGIAIREPGERKFKVLHGPSISQVFNTVRGDIAPEAAAIGRANIDRLLKRALEGKDGE